MHRSTRQDRVQGDAEGGRRRRRDRRGAPAPSGPGPGGDADPGVRSAWRAGSAPACCRPCLAWPWSSSPCWAWPSCAGCSAPCSSSAAAASAASASASRASSRAWPPRPTVRWDRHASWTCPSPVPAWCSTAGSSWAPRWCWWPHCPRPTADASCLLDLQVSELPPRGRHRHLPGRHPPGVERGRGPQPRHRVLPRGAALRAPAGPPPRIAPAGHRGARRVGPRVHVVGWRRRGAPERQPAAGGEVRGVVGRLSVRGRPERTGGGTDPRIGPPGPHEHGEAVGPPNQRWKVPWKRAGSTAGRSARRHPGAAAGQLSGRPLRSTASSCAGPGRPPRCRRRRPPGSAAS